MATDNTPTPQASEGWFPDLPGVRLTVFDWDGRNTGCRITILCQEDLRYQMTLLLELQEHGFRFRLPNGVPVRFGALPRVCSGAVN